MVAAATTALPERAAQGRSFDYRYAWIRDQCLAGHALLAAGRMQELQAAVAFICHRILEHGPGLAPAYTVHGGRLPDERRLGLPGYPGGADVAGNHVNEQFQLDAFGEALRLLAAAAGRDLLDGDGWRAAEPPLA
jgi:GH15 family glucan-1,4-alpha-glucosidase